MVAIGRALYVVDDRNRNYKFYARNNDYRKLSREELEKNMKSVSGYTRIFRTGMAKRFDF
ncbi:MAG: hypothetical protein V1659_01605, partial [Candidatus Woesearchaeota archaeon]